MLGRALDSLRQRRAKGTARKLTPPIELIAANNVGIHDKEHVLEEYDRIGRGIAGSLKSHAGMRPDSDVLDVGCGTGRVAIPLTSYLTTGTYTGIDVTESSIRWCQGAFKNFGNFRFFHADLYSEFYNPEATQTAENYQFPFENNSFDVVWSASLFTHLFLLAVDNYLGEMARVAKPGAKIWNSYLLLDEISEPLVLGPRNDGRRMQFEADGARYAYKNKPEHVVGLRRDRVLALHEKHGLTVVEERLSNWSGGRPETGYKGQDIILAHKS